MENQDYFRNELNSMDHRLTELEEKIDSIDEKLTQVIDAILGNKLTKTGGFTKDLEALKEKISLLERKQDKYDEFKKRITWTIGIVIGIAMLIQYITTVYSNVK
jgi:tetrahydromethanopterin S-methyltransferase subunit G